MHTKSAHYPNILRNVVVTLIGQLLLNTGCSTYSVVVEPNSNTYAPACASPVYLSTQGKTIRSVSSVKSYSPSSVSSTSTAVVTLSDGENISMYNLLVDAKAKFGEDVTIQNVRWDFKNKKRISVIYDVIKCR